MCVKDRVCVFERERERERDQTTGVTPSSHSNAKELHRLSHFCQSGKGKRQRRYKWAEFWAESAHRHATQHTHVTQKRSLERNTSYVSSKRLASDIGGYRCCCWCSHKDTLQKGSFSLFTPFLQPLSLVP